MFIYIIQTIQSQGRFKLRVKGIRYYGDTLGRYKPIHT